MLKFKFLTGDVNFTDYGGKWISNRRNNGEFDYWFVIELRNWEDCVGEREAKEIGAKYNLSLSVVAPSQAPEKERQSVLDSYGQESFQCLEREIEAFHAYGPKVNVWDANGNNWCKLMRQAKEEANKADMLFGFYMDRPVNKIGTSGWEAIRGDLLAPLRRVDENSPDNVKLMAKIQKGGEA